MYKVQLVKVKLGEERFFYYKVIFLSFTSKVAAVL